MSSVNPSLKRKRTGEKKLKNSSPAGSTQPLPGEERKTYRVKMDEVEYNSLEVFKSHTCTPKCKQYFLGETKALAVELHFKKFIESIFGRESVKKMVKGLALEYICFWCYLTDEETKILEGKQGVVEVEPMQDLGGRYL